MVQSGDHYGDHLRLNLGSISTVRGSFAGRNHLRACTVLSLTQLAKFLNVLNNFSNGDFPENSV